jgi:hypothetical protein
MAGFRGNAYAGVAGADLENAPTGPIPFTSSFGLPVTRANMWRAGGTQPGIGSGGVPGDPIQRASGNPSVVTNPTYRGPKLPYGGMPTQGLGISRAGISGGPPAPNTQTDPNINGAMVPVDNAGAAFISQFGRFRPLNPEQESAAPRPGRPVGGANDKLTTLDRHGIMKVGYENSGRNSGNTDPPLDGPARPSLWLVQRSLSYQQGTDTTGATDDFNRDYSRNSDGMYIGEQGTGWAPVYGGVPGLYQEYGSYSGVSPNSPNISQGIHSPAAQGQSGDGPHSVWSGPPHGLHSPTLPTYSQTLGRYLAIPQMTRPRIDRPSQSPIAGQSYSQTVQSQGQTGFNQAKQVLNVTRNGRIGGTGWRGRGAV